MNNDKIEPVYRRGNKTKLRLSTRRKSRKNYPKKTENARVQMQKAKYNETETRDISTDNEMNLAIESDIDVLSSTPAEVSNNGFSLRKLPIVLEGRRIVDIDFFIESLINFAAHSPEFGCSFQNMVIYHEERKGFISILHIFCNMCNGEFRISTSKEAENQDKICDSVNNGAVLGVMAIGSGYAQLQQLTASLDIPCLSERLYSYAHENICDIWEETCLKTMKEAAGEERALAVEAGEVNQNGTPLITVVADGSWAKRSYGCNYNSLSGAAAIVGYRTKKVLFLGVRNKFCTFCNFSSKTESQSVPEHKCYKNWSGSSASMEADIIADGFKKSMVMYDLIYHKVIADGDSNTYKKILDVHPYPNTQVQKIECKNHLLRNYSKKIRDLVKDTSAGPSVLRKNIEQNQIRLRWAVNKSIQHRKEENLPIAQKIQNLKKDLDNSLSHVFGEHKECQSLGYFCNEPFSPNESVLKDMKLTELYEKLSSYKNYLIRHASSLIYDVDNNSVEQFNSIIAKFIGGKRVNYCKKRSYQSRCAAAVVSHNTRKPIYTIRKHLNQGSTPSKYAKKFELSIIKKNTIRNKRCKTSKPATRRKLLFMDKKENESYGEKCEKPDMTDFEYTEAKSKFLNDIKQTKEDIEKIELLTREQANSDLWYLERRKRLTASVFGAVCKRRPTTSCKSLVETILYPKQFYSKACDYGKKHEETAKQQLQKIIGKTITPCGLFIDKKHQFLAATPDGVTGDRGIVEIKCPYSAREMTPEAGIETKKITFWVKNEVNTHHKWFFQIQGQLHVTEKQYCVFAVWTPHGIKTETILRDSDFWTNNMEPFLHKFYFDCILPEIIDSRKARNMAVKEPEYIIKAIERKKKHEK